MGIDTVRFISGVPQDAYCITCSKILEDPVEIVECGHLVCSSCWVNIINEDNCEDDSINNNSSKCSCPFCGTSVCERNVRKSTLTWNLIQNMDVYCQNRSSGCESVHKYCYDTLHRQKCPFEDVVFSDGCNDVDFSTDELKCSTCGCNDGQHDCTTELLRMLKRQATHISNLELENAKIAFQLATREKVPPEAERNFYMETLKYNKEIRDLRTRLAVIQGEVGRRKGDVSLLLLLYYITHFHLFILS